MTLLIMDAFDAAVLGVLTSILLWMWCHRSIYSWRDFSIMGLLMLSMVLRFVKGTPPESHFFGIMTMNALFVIMAAMVWARPSRIPVQEKKNKCFIVRVALDIWWLIRGKKGETANG